VTPNSQWTRRDASAYAIITKGRDSVYRWRVFSFEDSDDSHVGKAKTLIGAKRAASHWFNLM